MKFKIVLVVALILGSNLLLTGSYNFEWIVYHINKEGLISKAQINRDGAVLEQYKNNLFDIINPGELFWWASLLY